MFLNINHCNIEINKKMSVNTTFNSGFLGRQVGWEGKEGRKTCICVHLTSVLLEFEYVNTY